MLKTIVSIILLLLVIYVLIGLYLYLNQRNFLYFPTENIESSYKNIKFQNDNAKINVIVLNEGCENAILYFGGNAESMSESSDYIAKQFPQFTVYLMDYRGYGDSTGEPSENGLYSDSLKLYDIVKKRHNRISIGGRSLGTAIATYVAAHREVIKLALITPFDSILNVAQEKYSIYPINLLLHDKYNSVSRVKDISAKTLIVIAQNDEVVSRERTQKLINAFPKDILEVETILNRGHNDISSDEKYYKLMQDFIGDG
jgi:esterase/lipase